MPALSPPSEENFPAGPGEAPRQRATSAVPSGAFSRRPYHAEVERRGRADFHKKGMTGSDGKGPLSLPFAPSPRKGNAANRRDRQSGAYNKERRSPLSQPAGGPAAPFRSLPAARSPKHAKKPALFRPADVYNGLSSFVSSSCFTEILTFTLSFSSAESAFACFSSAWSPSLPSSSGRVP